MFWLGIGARHVAGRGNFLGHTPVIGLRRRDGFLCDGGVESLVGGIGEIPRHAEILCGNTLRVC